MSNTNLEITSGDTEFLGIAVKEVDKSPLDLSASNLVFTVKQYLNDLDVNALLQKDSDLLGGIAIDAGVGGTATLMLAPADTSSFPNEGPRYPYYWDLKLVMDNGFIAHLANGMLRVVNTVTD